MPTCTEFCLLFFVLVHVFSATASFLPPVTPLTVRSPYFSAWLPTTSVRTPPNEWPGTIQSPPGDSHQVLGWTGYVRIDGMSYEWLGTTTEYGGATNLTATTITPTRTVFTIQAGLMDLNVTFLSPIEPGDWTLQSLPFAYMYFEAWSTDGNEHSVQVYSDLTAEWLSADSTEIANWNTSTSTNYVYHEAFLATQSQYTERTPQGMAEWGSLYFATNTNSSMTYATEWSDTTRRAFNSSGALDGTLNTTFRAINNDYPVFAMSHDLGNISSTSEPVVWAIGFVQSPAISYVDLSGTSQDRYPYYMSTEYSDTDTLINDFLTNFTATKSRAESLDDSIMTAARKVSDEYADIVALAARQVFGALQLTVSKTSDGSWNTSDVLAFQKNLGDTAGNSRRVNAVETMYASWPFFMSVDPSMGPLLLETLLRFQNSSSYTNDYPAQDAGTAYPVATTNSDGHSAGVEQAGNMISMVYSLARTTGDASLVDQYYNLFKTWTDYIVSNVFTGSSNEPNVALKGIVAVRAMSQLSSALGKSADSSSYSTSASSLFSQWDPQSLTSAGLMMADFGDTGSWDLGYNLFFDKWLGTNFINSSIITAQTNKMKSLMTDTSYVYGIPYDSTDESYTTSSWQMFAAAVASDSTVRDSLISLLHEHAGTNVSATLGPFPNVYDPTSNQQWEVSTSALTGNGSGASPAQGAMYAFLALDITVQDIGTTSSSSSSTSSKSNAGAIAGGVVGGVAAVALVVVGLIWLRRRKTHEDPQIKDASFQPFLDKEPSTAQSFAMGNIPSETASAEIGIGASTATLSDKQRMRLREFERERQSSFSSTPFEWPGAGVAASQSGSGSRSGGGSVSGAGGGEGSDPASGTLSWSPNRRTRSSFSDPSTSVVSPGSAPRLSGTTDVDELRAQVIGLRQQMDEIRMERMPPPTYVSEDFRTGD